MPKMTREQGRWLAAELAIRLTADLAEDTKTLRERVNDWLLDADEFDKRDAVKLLTRELRMLALATRNRTDRLLETGEMKEVEG